MMKLICTFLFCIHVLFILSCSQRKEAKVISKKGLYIDSISFRHYKKITKPYLIESTTYAYNDSVSQVLDTMLMEKLIERNIFSRSQKDPLRYVIKGDTIMVDLIHIPGEGRFGFGEIKTRRDSIFLKLSGDVYREIPKVSTGLTVPYRYFRSEFRILVDSNFRYNIFFRHNDDFEAKH